MIRILHCVAGMNYGGYEAFIMNVYRNIDRDKIQFDFLSSFPGAYDEEIKRLGGRIFYIPFITQKGPLLYQKNLNKFFKEHPEYTIVHSHMDKISGSVMAAAKKAGVKVRIAHSHNIANEGGIAYHIVKDFYGLFVGPNCTHRFACSKEAARWMFGDKACEATVVYNGIDMKKYLPDGETRNALRREMRLENNFIVGHVGRFSQQKNHDFLIDIFREIKKLKTNAKLLLLGEGDLQPRIKEKVRRMKLEEDVIFYGTTNKVNEVIQVMDAFVLPSLFEGLGIVLIEAQSAGLYCTASSDVPPLAKISDNIQFLPLSRGAEKWAKAIVEKQPAPADINSLLNSDFNISKTADFLQNFYLERA